MSVADSSRLTRPEQRLTRNPFIAVGSSPSYTRHIVSPSVGTECSVPVPQTRVTDSEGNGPLFLSFTSVMHRLTQQEHQFARLSWTPHKGEVPVNEDVTYRSK